MITALSIRRVDPPRNTLCAYIDFELQPSGIVIHDCMLHRRGESEWVSFQARPQLDRDGRALKTPKTDKIAYSVVLEIKDPAKRERFQAAALAAIDRFLGREVAA